MNRTYLLTVVAPITLMLSSLAMACGSNEYEKCWSVNLGPLGTAKDCKCFPKISGTVGQVGEESKRAVNNLARELGKTPEALNSCLQNVSRCVNEIVAAPLALAVQAYIEGLYRQSENRTRSFSPQFIALAQPYFGVSLQSVTFAENINTGTGNSVSYCDRIFFAGSVNVFQNKNDLHHVLHELEHTVQCQGRGKRTYLAEYVLKVGLDILKTGRFNVHDVHDYEVSAEAKANNLTDTLWNAMQREAGAGAGFPANVPGQYAPPPMIPVRFCRTQFGTCSIAPMMVPMGSSCFCNGPYGRVPGSAF